MYCPVVCSGMFRACYSGPTALTPFSSFCGISPGLARAPTPLPHLITRARSDGSFYKLFASAGHGHRLSVRLCFPEWTGAVSNFSTLEPNTQVSSVADQVVNRASLPKFLLRNHAYRYTGIFIRSVFLDGRYAGMHGGLMSGGWAARQQNDLVQTTRLLPEASRQACAHLFASGMLC